ncbi:IPT/TIG domain-containing protein [Nocardia bovistercoris]|uniref:IPT/TIG domain-containing protein n=1 Tax=Nocardia bovistercoris TaxID=2785916 RepID=A0A931I633_9NOCA|nr:IPT/TIG domain-containing protein [Nocardia bovistercoris]MBH0775544.1 IPT/TIG domain-containing protein [Nocardia bovistercoris]
MAFELFPDPPVTPLPVGPQGVRVDTVFVQHAGVPMPEFAGIYAQMMFLRVAMIGPAMVPPRFFLRAGAGPPVEAVSDPTPIFRDAAAAGAAGLVGDVFSIAVSNQVFEIVVGFDQATTERWELGIENDDPTTVRLFTWIVAETPAETINAWVDPATFRPRFAEPPAAQFEPVTAAEGTPVTLTGDNFDIGAVRVAFGAITTELIGSPSRTRLVAAVPEGLDPETAVPITVTTTAGAAVSTVRFRAVARQVVLLGRADHGVEDVAAALRARGLRTVTVGAETFTADTALVAAVVSCVDGPMPDMRRSLHSLGGRTVARAAIVLTKTDVVADPEIQALVEAETRELLAGVHISPLDPHSVVRQPGPDVAAEVVRILALPEANYHVVAPLAATIGFADPPFTPERAKRGDPITLHVVNPEQEPLKVGFQPLWFGLPQQVVDAEIIGTSTGVSVQVRVPSLAMAGIHGLGSGVAVVSLVAGDHRIECGQRFQVESAVNP